VVLRGWGLDVTENEGGGVLLDINVGKNADYFVCASVRGNSKRISKLSALIVGKTVGKKEKGPEDPDSY